MDRPDRCQVCGKSKRLDGTPAELEIGNRCGQHSGKWMCLGCFLRWTEQPEVKEGRHDETSRQQATANAAMDSAERQVLDLRMRPRTAI